MSTVRPPDAAARTLPTAVVHDVGAPLEVKQTSPVDALEAGAPRGAGSLEATRAKTEFKARVAALFDEVAAAAQATPAGARPIKTIDDANLYAAEQLQKELTRRGVDPERAKVWVELPASLWRPGDLANQAQIHLGVARAVGFAAQMAEDAGGSLRLNVLISPRGALVKTSGANKDSLYVPLNKGLDEVGLRQAWDRGDFIKADHWWNPIDWIVAAKKRAIWKLAENPVGVVRARFGRLLEAAKTELTGALDKIESHAKSGELKGPDLQKALTQVIERWVSPDVRGADSASFRATVLKRIAKLDDPSLLALIGRWKTGAGEEQAMSDVARTCTVASVNQLKDSTIKVGFVNVDTYDSVVVAPPNSVMGRHGELAANLIEHKGVRVGFVNVMSTDMVTVLPDLARMIFGGATLEHAL